MKPRLALIAVMFFLAVGARLSAQEDTFYRLELGGGIGAGFSLNDLNNKFFGFPHVSGALVARFPLNPRMAVKTRVDYLGLRGNTTKVTDFYPANPNASGTETLDYKMSGSQVGLTALYELHFLPYGWLRGFQGHCRLVPYIQAGLGLVYATPGKAFTMDIPVGIGLKWKVRERLNLGLDWTFHFTPSDKLDGLSAPHGIASSEFRNKDHFSLMLFTLTYDLSPKCPTCNKD